MIQRHLKAKIKLREKYMKCNYCLNAVKRYTILYTGHAHISCLREKNNSKVLNNLFSV